jgi:hypothetical protein
MSIDLKDYLYSPNMCPYCCGQNVVGGDVDFGDINAWRNVQCQDCGKKWTEEFTITDVKEDDK